MSAYAQQKITKPEIEDMIPQMLCGDSMQRALDFAAYLRANKLRPVWASANSWKCSSKGKGVCYVRLRDGYLSISPYVDYTKECEEFAIKEGLREIVWQNLAFCRRCNPNSCAQRLKEPAETFCGVRRTFWGREFDGICVGGGDAHFHDPDDAQIHCIKKLIDFRRQAIEANGVKKIKYMAEKRRISQTEVIAIDREIKIVGLSLAKAGWAGESARIGDLWSLYTDEHRRLSNAKRPVVEYGLWYRTESGGYDYIIGNEVTDFRETGDEQIGVTIPAGRYIKDTFNAFDFEQLVEEAIGNRAVQKWAEENGLKILGMPPFPVAGIEVYPVERMTRSDGDAADGNFRRDDRIKAKFPSMYTLTPVAP